VSTLWEDGIHDRSVEREIILETIEQGIGDRMDIDTNASHWAQGVLDALLREGFVVVRQEDAQ
jgi:hypothetical protein